MYGTVKKLQSKKGSMAVGVVGCIVLMLLGMSIGVGSQIMKMRAYDLEEKQLIGKLMIEFVLQRRKENDLADIVYFNNGYVQVKKENDVLQLTSHLVSGEQVFQQFIMKETTN